MSRELTIKATIKDFIQRTTPTIATKAVGLENVTVILSLDKTIEMDGIKVGAIQKEIRIMINIERAMLFKEHFSEEEWEKILQIKV